MKLLFLFVGVVVFFWVFAEGLEAIFINADESAKETSDDE